MHAKPEAYFLPLIQATPAAAAAELIMLVWACQHSSRAFSATLQHGHWPAL